MAVLTITKTTMNKIMIKYIPALIGVMMMFFFFSACTDREDIDLVYHHNVELEINPLDLYQNSGIDVVKFQTMMGTKIYKPCITVLIYNSDGTLNRKNEFIVDNLQPFSQIITDFDEKEYTIIALQHFIIEANDKVSSVWTLADEEDINTVHISVSSLTGEIYWFNCLGIDAQKINIKRGSRISISTKLAGCFVNFQYENLDKSSYYRTGLYYKDRADGLYLNPDYQGNDRYYYKNGFNAPNIWSSVALFSNENGLKESDGETRFFFETGRINYCIGLTKPSDVDNDGIIHFTAYPSQNSYFDAEKGKYYTAFCYYNGSTDKISTYMGLKSEFNSWYDNLDKWIIPYFEQPYITWGASVADVKQYMDDKNYKLWFDIDESNGIYWLGYAGKYKEDNIQYAFSSESNDLLVSMITIPYSNLSSKDILNIFDENNEYGRIKLYDQCYEMYGCYIYINDDTQVQIYPDGHWDNGERFTSIQYYPRTYVDAETMNTNYVSDKRIGLRKSLNINPKSYF